MEKKANKEEKEGGNNSTNGEEERGEEDIPKESELNDAPIEGRKEDPPNEGVEKEKIGRMTPPMMKNRMIGFNRMKKKQKEKRRRRSTVKYILLKFSHGQIQRMCENTGQIRRKRLEGQTQNVEQGKDRSIILTAEVTASRQQMEELNLEYRENEQDGGENGNPECVCFPTIPRNTADEEKKKKRRRRIKRKRATWQKRGGKS